MYTDTKGWCGGTKIIVLSKIYSTPYKLNIQIENLKFILLTFKAASEA